MKKLMIVLAMMFFTVSFTACQDEAADATPTTVEVDDVETPDGDGNGCDDPMGDCPDNNGNNGVSGD